MVGYADHAPQWLVQTIGVFLFFPGLLLLTSLLRRKRQNTTERFSFLIASFATMILGGLLIAWPGTFILGFMYVMGTTIIFFGILQLTERTNMWRKGIGVSLSSMLIPVLTISAGIFVLIFYREITTLPFILIGVCCILYSLLEIHSVLQWNKYNKQQKSKEVSIEIDAKPIPENETSSEDTSSNKS